MEVPKYNNLIDGKATAANIRSEVRSKVDALSKAYGGRQPKLAVVLVGDRRDSATYVEMKRRATVECNIEFQLVKLPVDVPENELLSTVRKLNTDKGIHAILVQLPLPDHIQEDSVIDCIDWKKDADGLSPANVGFLALKGRCPRSRPCTADGCMQLCSAYNVELKGAEVVVLGRSNVVGMPVALLMQQADATVTMCHSRTKDIEAVCRRADVVIAAIGKPQIVKGSWIKEGTVVIDVGINSVDDAETAKGYRLVGDVDFKEVQPKCKLISPVPGGVGPMTVALLMRNTVNSFEALCIDEKKEHC